MHPWAGLSDQVRLGAVTRWVTPELVAAGLAECGVSDKKPGALPAGFMVYFTLALALFQQDSYDDVAEHLVRGVPELSGSIPNKSSFARARQRLGAQAIETVFRKLTGPLAPAGLEGSFYRGMRLAAVDGFVLDAPETQANRRRLGGPKDARGQVAGFPQVRVVTLTETGTHAQIDAAVDGFSCGEPELAVRLAPSAAGMLVIMDRGFPGVALWRAYTGAGAHLLIRARSCVAARPIDYLPDGTYLARMNLAGQKRAAPGHVVVRVIEYEVDGGEVIRLLTDLPGPRGISGCRARGPLPGKVGGGILIPPDQDIPARPAADPALRRPRPGVPGGMGAPGRPPLPDQDHHGAGRRSGNRPGPHLLPQGPQARAAQCDRTDRHHCHQDARLHGHAGVQGGPQAR
jgi:Insertion element 4 transposase N-terminal